MGKPWGCDGHGASFRPLLEIYLTNWYTADLHLGHDNIIRFCHRPFATTAEMDKTLLKTLQQCVGGRDDLWILGDFSCGKAAKNRRWLHQMFDQLPGARKHLVLGNHDHHETRALPWDSISTLTEVVDGAGRGSAGVTEFALCHYPMITWKNARRGALQLFGHVHTSWRGSRNAVNVGVDVWNYRPVRLDEVMQRAASLPVNQHWHDVEPRAD